MRSVVAALLVGAALPAWAGLGYENENQFHGRPYTHVDTTAALAASMPAQERPDVGPTVARVRAYSATGNTTLELVSGPRTGLENGDWITVRLTNPGAVGQSAKELSRQWVGVFGPASVNASTTTPIKYTLASVDSSFGSTGVAEMRFRLLNMRVPVDLVFFEDCRVPAYYEKDRSIHSCRATLRLGPFEFADYEQPHRIAVLRDVERTSLRVAFTTKTAAGALGVEFQPVDASGHATAAPSTAPAVSSVPYAPSDLCQAPASTYGFFHPGTRSIASLTGLVPGTTYQYWVVNGTQRRSDVMTVKAPAATGANETASLLVYADLGRGTEDGALTWDDYGRPALNTSRRMAQDLDRGVGVDGIFHVGDISYAVGFLSIWDTYADMMQPVLSRTAYALNYGNHEADSPAETTPAGRTVTLFNGSDSGGECGVVTDGWFPMPWGGPDTPWYSFDVGPVHIVAMGTEHDFREGSAQHAWLEADLKAVDRSVTPWILFGGHRPMYIDSTYGGKWDSDLNVAQMLVDHVEPLLLRYGVDLAVWGHNHVVQRMCQLARHECVSMSAGAENAYPKDGGGVVHLVIGAAGASFSNNVNIPKLPTTEFSAYRYGHSTMEFEGGQSMTWKWIDNSNGEVLDSMTITNAMPHPSPAPEPGSFPPGAIAAIAGGGAVAIAAAVAAVWWCRPKRRGGDETTSLRSDHGTSSSPYLKIDVP